MSSASREDDRADVAALDHSPAVRLGPGPLALDQLAPHLGVGGHDRDGPPHLGRADDVGHVAAVDERPAPRPRCVPPAASAATAGCVVGRDAAREGEGGHGAVHGSRIEPVDAEVLGHRGRDRRLARAGRAVDGDEQRPRRQSRRTGRTPAAGPSAKPG